MGICDRPMVCVMVTVHFTVSRLAVFHYLTLTLTQTLTPNRNPNLPLGSGKRQNGKSRIDVHSYYTHVTWVYDWYTLENLAFWRHRQVEMPFKYNVQTSNLNGRDVKVKHYLHAPCRLVSGVANGVR